MYKRQIREWFKESQNVIPEYIDETIFYLGSSYAFIWKNIGTDVFFNGNYHSNNNDFDQYLKRLSYTFKNLYENKYFKMLVKKNIKILNHWIKKNTTIEADILSIKKFEAGQSNPTYLLKSEYKNFVLRSKPTGKLLPGAHRIDREFKVMSSLEASTIPVPKMFLSLIHI